MLQDHKRHSNRGGQFVSHGKVHRSTVMRVVPPEGALLLKQEWITKEVVVTYVECRGCKSKGIQTHEN